jgi:hypothetical protein
VDGQQPPEASQVPSWPDGDHDALALVEAWGRVDFGPAQFREWFLGVAAGP